MKLYLAVAVLVSISSTGDSAKSQTFYSSKLQTFNVKCHLGDYWYDKCNICFCNINRITCTNVECQSQTHENEIEVEESYKQLCEPGKWWKTDCEICYCTYNQMPKCIVNHCSESQRDKRAAEGALLCQPNHKWFDGCNNCGCNADGIAYCTYKYCSQEDHLKNVQYCKPGDKWKLKGKKCHCSENGTVECADSRKRRGLNREVDDSEEERENRRRRKEGKPQLFCEPKFEWDTGCGKYRCDEDSKVFYKSLGSCDDPATQSKKVPRCKEGNTWNYGNRNTLSCVCKDGEGQCTTK